MKTAIGFLVLAVATSSWGMPTELASKGQDLNAKDHVPSRVCQSMMPEHGNSVPSNAPSPYKLTVIKPEGPVAPGDVIRVHVSGSAPFKGVYMQARQGDRIVGEFVLHEQDTDKLALSDCPPGHKNAVTLVSREDFDKLTVGWKAPEMSGDIVFRATIVKTFSEFWLGVESEKVHIQGEQKTVEAPQKAIAA